MSKTIHKLEFEDLKPTPIESEVPEQHKIREATHDVAKLSDTPLSQAETVEYDMDSYVPVITQTKEKENRKEPRHAGVFKVENPIYSCIHGELVPGPHKLRQVTNEDEQQVDRKDDGEEKTPNHQDNNIKAEEVIKKDIHGDRIEDRPDKKKEDMHGEEKKPKTRIPISKFKQAAESVTEQRRAIKNEKVPEAKPLNKESRVQQSKPQQTGVPNKPPRLSIEKNKISSMVNYPKTLNEKFDTSKKHINSAVGNKTDDKILKNPAISKAVTNTHNKPHISEEIRLKDEFKNKVDNATIPKPNETESNMNNKINPSEKQVETHIDNQFNDNTLATGDVKKIQVEDEFEKLYEEIVDPEEVDLDNSLLNNKIDDPEKVENKFEDIIHAYDDHDQLEAEEVRVKSKIPLLKRRSEHEIIVPAQIRRLSLKSPPSVEKGKVNNPFKRSVNQTENKKEIPKPNPIKKQSETSKEKFLSRLAFLRKVKEPKKEDKKEKQPDVDQLQTKDIKNKSSNTKELNAEPKNIIEETILIRDFTQPKLRENKPDKAEAKIEKETINEEKNEKPVKEHLKSQHNIEGQNEQKSPTKERKTVNQDKGHDELKQIQQKTNKEDKKEKQPDVDQVRTENIENKSEESSNTKPKNIIEETILIRDFPQPKLRENKPDMAETKIEKETRNEEKSEKQVKQHLKSQHNIEGHDELEQIQQKTNEEDKKEKQPDVDQVQTENIENKSEELSNTKELDAEPKNIIEEIILIRDLPQPKLRENKPDMAETKIEKETRNEEKSEKPVKQHLKSQHNIEGQDEQRSPTKERKTVKQDKGHDEVEQIQQKTNKEDKREKQPDVDQVQTESIENKSEESSNAKELDVEPKDIIKETILTRDLPQPKLRENKPDMAETKIETETRNEEKSEKPVKQHLKSQHNIEGQDEQRSPTKERKTVKQDKGHDEVEQIQQKTNKEDKREKQPDVDQVQTESIENKSEESSNAKELDAESKDIIKETILIRDFPQPKLRENKPDMAETKIEKETRNEEKSEKPVKQHLKSQHNIEGQDEQRSPTKERKTVKQDKGHDEVEQIQQKTNKEDKREKQPDVDQVQTESIENKSEESSNEKKLDAEPKDIIKETILIRDFPQLKLRENKPDMAKTKIEKEKRNEEKNAEPVKQHLKSQHNAEDQDKQKSPTKERKTIKQDKRPDELEQMPVEKVEIRYGKPHEFKNIQKEADITFNPTKSEFGSQPENNNDKERNVESANVDKVQHKPSAHEKEVVKIPIHTTKVHLPVNKHLLEPQDKPKTEPILKTETVKNIQESVNIGEPNIVDETIKKAQEINKETDHEHQEKSQQSDEPKEVIKEGTTPETCHIEYNQPEETSVLNRTGNPQEMLLLNKKEEFVEKDYKVQEMPIINKEVMKENICEKHDTTKEISILIHKKERNEDADKDQEELNEVSFSNDKENVVEEFTKENKQLDDEEIPLLKGKVSNIINKIHSNNLAHVEIKKEEPNEEKPKKRSILSKIAMFERKDTSAPVQKRLHPQHKDTKIQTHHVEVVDINKPVDKPSVVAEILKPIQREPILKQEIHQDADAMKTVDIKQNNFEQPKQLLIIEDIREHTSTIYDNKNDELNIISKENVSALHDNNPAINKETKDKIKPIKTEEIPKTEKMKITSILKSKDLNSNPSTHKFKQDKKEIKTSKKVENLSLEPVEKHQRKQDPKIFIPEKTDEKPNKELKPNTPPLQSTMQTYEKTVNPEIHKLPNEKGYNFEEHKDNLSNESLTNDVFDNDKTDTEVEIINVVKRKPKKREERPKSVAEMDLGDAVKGIVHKMIVRMNSTELLNVEKKEIISAKERPRKKSVSEKIELFEKKLTPVEIKGVKNRETHAKSTQNLFQEEKRITEDEYERIINDLKNAKLNYGRVTEMVYLDFNNGHMMPVLNIGTALLDKRLIHHVIGAAIDLGYRGIDTAYVYGNEKEVGEAIQAKINDGTVTREDLFITSKLWNTYHRPDLVAKACRNSLQAMGLEYFDLYLIHTPMSFKEGKDPIPKIANVIQYSEFDYMDAWYAMEELVGEGLVQSIGVSNFNSDQIARVVEKSRIKPVVNQVECHPYLSQRNLDDFCNARDVMLSCFGTLGSKGTPDHLKTLLQPVIEDPLVKVMAAGLNVTPAQMLIRYQIENRRTVVVKATKADHLWSNLQTIKMSLDSRQIDALDALNRNKRIYDFKGMGETHKNYPFNRPF